MPRIAPFTGSLFDRTLVPSLEPVTTPPYDTIPAEHQRRLRAASPYNLIHIDLEEGGEGGAPAKYTAAGRKLRRWREDGVLVPTDRPAYFAYEMRFSLGGRRRRLRGFLGAVELEPWGGGIVPHERTMEGPIEDRLALMRAVAANLSPIYAVFDGPCRPLAELLAAAARTEPERSLTDEEGTEHRLWVLRGSEPVGEWLANEPLLIADGHHRYTMALRYREEMHAAHGPGPWDRTMMLVVDAASEDPPILPIHRILRSGEPPHGGDPRPNLETVLADVDDADARIGVAVPNRGGDLDFRVLRMDAGPPAVQALHDSVLEGHDGELRFTHDPRAAEAAVWTGEAVAAFFLPPTTVPHVRAAIRVRGRLPQKSTFFWPKPRTGMVIRTLDGDTHGALPGPPPAGPARRRRSVRAS